MDKDHQESLSQDDKIKLLTRVDSDKRLKTVINMVGVVVGAAALYLVFSYMSSINTHSGTSKLEETPETLSEQVDTEASRTDFKEALAEFEQKITPFLKDTGLNTWAEKRVAQLLAKKEEVLIHFAQGAYTLAHNDLRQLESDVLILTEEWDQAFFDTLASAQIAFDEDRINLASINLQKAAKIKPNAEEVESLQSRINAYGKVNEHIKNYEVSLVENDLKKQVSSLNNALTLDPLRTELSPLLEAARSELKEQTLKSKLHSAQQALTQGDYALAERMYAEVTQLSPNDPAVAALRLELDKISEQQALNEAVETANMLAQEDQWELVFDHTSQALALFPDHALLHQLNSSSVDILNTHKTLRGYTSRPQRLTDRNIRETAKAALKDSVTLMTKSAKLAQEIKKLGALIKDMESTVALTVTSDNRTHIIVKGKGIIGKTKKKTVSLTPGNYILEANRDGYRSKMLEVTLSPGQGVETVHLVCDEKI